MRRRRIVLAVVWATAALITVLVASWIWAASRNFNGRRDVPGEFVDKFHPYEPVLQAEGDRLLREAGVDPGNPACELDPTHQPATYSTEDAPPDLKAALTELGVEERLVSHCAVLFQIPGSVGFGADNPGALLYKGTERYTPDASCEGLMGATEASSPLAPDWYVGYALHC